MRTLNDLLADHPALPARAWTLIPPLLVIAAALAAYANAWPNALVHDDKFYYGADRFSDFSNIPRYFSENIWASTGITEPFYRPFLMISVSLDARIYGDWAAGYHLTNIGLHAIVSLLVFVFIRQVLRKSGSSGREAASIALMVALIFAVHPVYSEVVNSIFNRSDILVALGSLGGLIWFLHRLDSNRASAWIGLGLAYLFTLFCKENALVLPALAVILLWALSPGDWRSRLRQSLPVFWLLLPLALYLVMRAHALEPIDLTGTEVTPSPDNRPIDVTRGGLRFPDLNRLLLIAALWYESFKIMLWPSPLLLIRGAVSPWSAYAGLILLLLFAPFAIHRFRSGRYGLVLGFAFFITALLPASRIIGDPSTLPHLAERYLYFPSVGMAIMLAFGFGALARRTDLLLAAALTVLATVLLTPVTWSRNAEWSDEIRLYESDLRNGNTESAALVWLSAAYLKESEFHKVASLCDQRSEAQRGSGKLSMHCATAYSRLGRVDEAERAYLFAISDHRVRPMAHANLGRFYLRQNRWRDAKLHFEKAIEAEPLPVNRAFRTGHMLVRLYPRDRRKLLEAKAYFEEALELQPDFAPARHWLDRVERALASG